LQSVLLDQKRIHDLQAQVARNWPRPKQGLLQQVVSALQRVQFRITNTDLLQASAKPDLTPGEAAFFAHLQVTDFSGQRAEPFDAPKYVTDIQKESKQQLDRVAAQAATTNTAAQQLLQLRLGDVMAKLGVWALLVAILALAVAGVAAFFAYESVQSVGSSATQMHASPSPVKSPLTP
jgi:hypothetical protein